MALIFFDGFTRAPIDGHYWTLTGATLTAGAGPDSGFVTFSGSLPVTNNAKLGNIGAHSNKKLYLGLRPQAYTVRNNQLFLRFYDANDTAVLDLTWNTADVTSPDVGLNVVKYGAYTPVTGAPVYDLTVDGVAYKVTLLDGNYADNSARFNTTEMPWWGNQTTANAWATAWCEQELPAYSPGTPGSLDPYLAWRIRPFTEFNPYVVDSARPSYAPESSCTPGTDSFTHDGVYSGGHRWVILDLSLNPPTTGTIAATYVVDNDISGVVFNSVSGGGTSGLYIFNAARTLEFEFDLANGTFAIMYAGQTIQTLSGTTLSSLGGAGFDVSSLAIFGGFTSGGDALLDMYLVDDTGSVTNTWLGANFRVHSPTHPGGQPLINSGWSGVPGFDGSYLDSSDSDTSYVRAATIGAEIAFNTNNISPTGFNPVVAGIRVASTSRGGLLDAAYKYLYRNQTATTNHEMGSRIVLTDNMYARQTAQFINTNPDTAAQWTVAEINAGAFGLKAVDPE